ncbi:ABC transporter permease, partial [Bacillus sp. S34]|nr:ABC transporter permease [Bacillus sp. S34]
VGRQHDAGHGDGLAADLVMFEAFGPARFAGFAVWLATADLTPTERTTLNPADILALTGQHLVLTLESTVLVLVIGIPLGVLLTRGPLRRASVYVLAVANFGQAAPAVGLIVLLAAWLGLNSWSAVVALVLYAI